MLLMLTLKGLFIDGDCLEQYKGGRGFSFIVNSKFLAGNVKYQRPKAHKLRGNVTAYLYCDGYVFFLSAISEP